MRIFYLSIYTASIVRAYDFGESYSNHGYADSMVWENKADFPGEGRHHPITFANSTHGFVLTGSTGFNPFNADFWVYEEATDRWTDLSLTSSAFPGLPRSYGYGIASVSDCSNTKAYVGFGLAAGKVLTDFWEFDMATNDWNRLAEFPGAGRRHPAMNFVESIGEIHVGCGDGVGGNFNDWWAYNIENNMWKRLTDFPSSKRHHPYYFVIGTDSFVGLGHSDGYDPFIERDWYRYDSLNGSWNREEDFTSYALGSSSLSAPLTTEARAAGTQFSVTGSCESKEALGFILSGDGDDHGLMMTGEFHVFDRSTKSWHSLPPHPGISRWAPGSFVLQGTTNAYFFGGYDRQTGIYHSDLLKIDLAPLFATTDDFQSSRPTVYSSLFPSNNSTSGVSRDLCSMKWQLAWITMLPTVLLLSVLL